jgi:hypothetical protein
MCSNEKLNKIWNDGVRTVDMCTVEAGRLLRLGKCRKQGHGSWDNIGRHVDMGHDRETK